MNDGAQIALLALTLILPLSALIARRVPIGATLKMALAWAAIFAVATILIAQRDRLAPAWRAIAGDARDASGTPVRIARGPDGHFHVDVSLDGVSRRMLIDTGATTTALSTATARAAGLSLDDAAFPRMVATANGEVLAQPVRIGELRIGSIVLRDVTVLVSDAFEDDDVIGMNVLSRLRGWRVEGATLHLDPKFT